MYSSSQVEIMALVGQAREQGKPDVFAGKRRWSRYTLGMRLLVTTDPTRSSATWPVSMHNISGGGLGFWARSRLAEGAAIHVRDGTEGDSGTWLPAHVTHCTVGLRGYLIGAAFDDPAPPDDDPSTEPEPAIEPAQAKPASRRSIHGLRSLQTTRACTTGTACGAAFLAAYLISDFVPADLGVIAHLILPAVIAVTLGACWSWAASRKEVHFLNALQNGIREIATKSTEEFAAAEPPSKELGSLKRTFLNLGAKWRQREDDERVQRQKLEELAQIKSNILAIVSHDLRTPLTSILLYAQMLTDELETLSVEDQRNFLGIISSECTRLSRLVDDLLEVQRLENNRVRWDLKPQDISSTIRASVRVFEALAQSKSMALTVDCPDQLPPVSADSDRISQVLNNLVSNALKYTPAGGAVEVSAEARGNEIVLRVADNGPGIPRDKWDQIFDRFAQLGDPNVAEIAGVGLGLYIVKRIIEAHGGTVWVDSEVGRGSEFMVALPTRATPPVIKNSEKNPRSVARRVVVCDSDPELVATIAQTLRNDNYDVRTAHAGCRLLAQLDHGDVDVVITDLLLPDMNAAEILESLNRVSDRRFRLIVHSYAGDARDLSRRGVDVFLRRPVSGQELLQAVRVASKKHAASGMVVLLVGSDNVDVTRFNALLSDRGHMPMIAENLEEAERLLGDYATDVVLVSDRLLATDWHELDDLSGHGSEATRILVLCEYVRRRERKLEEDLDVTAIPYRMGQEQEVVDAITTPEKSVATR